MLLNPLYQWWDFHHQWRLRWNFWNLPTTVITEEDRATRSTQEGQEKPPKERVSCNGMMKMVHHHHNHHHHHPPHRHHHPHRHRPRPHPHHHVFVDEQVSPFFSSLNVFNTGHFASWDSLYLLNFATFCARMKPFGRTNIVQLCGSLVQAGDISPSPKKETKVFQTLNPSFGYPIVSILGIILEDLCSFCSGFFPLKLPRHWTPDRRPWG